MLVKNVVHGSSSMRGILFILDYAALMQITTWSDRQYYISNFLTTT